MGRHTFQQVISLGPNCRTKFHLRHNFGQYSGVLGVFDWQLTPAPAVIEYLRRDFTGMFEREDLRVVGGKVINARFDTSHLHAFPEGVTEDMLESLYPAAREGHQHRCRRTRALLTNGRSTLFVFGLPVAQSDIDEISGLLEDVSPGRRFLVLPCPQGDHGEHWAGDPALWRAHLAPFSIRPPLLARLRLKFRRPRKKPGAGKLAAAAP